MSAVPWLKFPSSSFYKGHARATVYSARRTVFPTPSLNAILSIVTSHLLHNADPQQSYPRRHPLCCSCHCDPGPCGGRPLCLHNGPLPLRKHGGGPVDLRGEFVLRKPFRTGLTSVHLVHRSRGQAMAVAGEGLVGAGVVWSD